MDHYAVRTARNLAKPAEPWPAPESLELLEHQDYQTAWQGLLGRFTVEVPKDKEQLRQWHADLARRIEAGLFAKRILAIQEAVANGWMPAFDAVADLTIVSRISAEGYQLPDNLTIKHSLVDGLLTIQDLELLWHDGARAMGQFIVGNLPLIPHVFATHLARRLARIHPQKRRELLPIFKAEGLVGLVEAVKRYDYQKKGRDGKSIPFSGISYPYVRKFVGEAFVQYGYEVPITPYNDVRLAKLNKLHTSLGRLPTAQEAKEAFRWSKETFEALLRVRQAAYFGHVSLDQSLNPEGGGESLYDVKDRDAHTGSNEALDSVELELVLNFCRQHQPTGIEILIRHLGLDGAEQQELKTIAGVLQISVEDAERHYQAALTLLRRAMTNQDMYSNPSIPHLKLLYFLT